MLFVQPADARATKIIKIRHGDAYKSDCIINSIKYINIDFPNRSRSRLFQSGFGRRFTGSIMAFPGSPTLPSPGRSLTNFCRFSPFFPIFKKLTLLVLPPLISRLSRQTTQIRKYSIKGVFVSANVRFCHNLSYNVTICRAVFLRAQLKLSFLFIPCRQS